MSLSGWQIMRCATWKGNHRTGKAVFLLLTLLFVCSRAEAQQPQDDLTNASDLARENLSRVAASAAQIEGVLRKEPGLMVELKHWVAKEATDHGQIVSDSDLTDQAIFDRLASDVEFRSVATRLLQRYGYLLPKLNPESELAKEQDLLLRERANRLMRAQQRAEQEEEIPGSRSGAQVDRTRSCDPALDQDCANQEHRPPQLRPGQTYAPVVPPEGTAPSAPDRIAPQLSPGNPLQQPEFSSRQLVQTGMEAGVGLTQPAIQSPSQSAGSPGSSILSSPEIDPTLGTELEETRLPSPPNSQQVASNRTRPLVGPGNEEREKGRGGQERPPMVHRPNPYADIPSLYDMYMQVSARQPAQERFGLDVFRDGTQPSDYLPMDLPVGPDYVVGPGDGLAIDLWGGVSQRLYRTVDREGRVALPEVGPVLVSGRTLGEVQQAVQQILRTQFRDVSADVSLSRLRTVRVYVVGDVGRPGAYDVSSLSTPLNALFYASGPTARGSLRILKHYRGKQLVQDVDVYDLLLHGVKGDIERLENGDTVLVPPIGHQVTVEGMVRRPASYELRTENTLAEVLELAGGILPSATLRHIEVQRVAAHEKRTMLSLDISDAQDTEAVRKQLESFAIQDGDDVRIFPIASYNQDAVYLEGHVLRPGRYSYRAGMKLTDLFSSYKDLMPEPAAKYAEIIRLNPPDFRPSVESFSLADALASPAAAPALQPMDTVRIFGRYDFENPPFVSVGGAVRTPGTYRSAGQVHLSDAIHSAGGLTPDAFTEDAQVFRYLPDSHLRIMSVKLKEALAGDPMDNILLEPRDRILVHRNPAKVDPASVYIEGEVAKPGRYPLTNNLHVADLIRIAGGFKRSADTESADLTRYLMQERKKPVGEHFEIPIATALAGDPNSDIPLRDGDVVTIRQIPGWKDIGASVTVQGEVGHPGTYGVRPGERLSSVLRRAGGFLPTAYPQGVVFERASVRELQEKSRQELILRIRQEAGSFKTSPQQSAQEQAALQQAALEQRRREIEALEQAPVTGRIVVWLRSNLAEFEKSPDNLALRNGDSIYIPKRPDVVLVNGQVYNSNAITFMRGKNAGWYLRQAGGPTDQANKKAIFIVRANGSVVSGKGDWWSGNVLSTQMEAGDTIVVPEKAIGGSTAWKNLLGIAQITQAAAITALVLP